MERKTLVLVFLRAAHCASTACLLPQEGQLARAKEELESALKVLPDCADLHELLLLSCKL